MRPILGRIAIVIQVLIILGCKNPNNEIDKLSYNTNYQDRFELVNTKSVVIPLDSTQGFFNNSLRWNNNNTIFCFFYCTITYIYLCKK